MTQRPGVRLTVRTWFGCRNSRGRFPATAPAMVGRPQRTALAGASAYLRGWRHGGHKEGPGRSHADPGLKFGNARGPLAFNNCSMNTFYEAFATAYPAVKRVVLDALPRSI